MKTVTQAELVEIIRLHKLWRDAVEGGVRADLSETDLRGTDLSGANLRWANLSETDLRGTDLSGADLRWADLSRSDLSGAYLYGADLSKAYLSGADLKDAILPDFQICPQDTEFIGFKKVSGVSGDIILKLLIQGNRTSSLIGRKCRASRVKVLEAINSNSNSNETVFSSKRDSTFKYTIGETVEVNYDGDIRIECTSGIHFFMTQKEAEEY